MSSTEHVPAPSTPDSPPAAPHMTGPSAGAADIIQASRPSAWTRLRRRPATLISLIVILLVALIAFGATLLNLVDPTAQNIDIPGNLSPSWQHWAGTDRFGRDLFARLLMGVRISLTIAFFAGLLDLTMGVAYGLVSGLSGRKVDGAMQRILEILSGIPTLVVLVLMLVMFEPGLFTIVAAMAVTGWIPMARLVRAQALRLREQEFMLAARSLGAGRVRLALRHIIPNSAGIIVVQTMFTIPTAIFFESFLSFIGLGLRPPIASLGTLLSDGFQNFMFFPYQMIIPAVTLSALMIAFNLLADGLRDVLDPKGVTIR